MQPTPQPSQPPKSQQLLQYAKGFYLAFLVLAGVSAYFLLTDERGSGMGWPLGIFSALALVAFLLDTRYRYIQKKDGRNG